MRWTRGYSSNDVDDRRGEGPASAGLGGAPIGILFWLFSRFGLPGVLVGAVGLYLFSQFGGGGGGNDAPAQHAAGSTEAEEGKQFVSWVLDDVQNTWDARFKQQGQPYRRARMTLFRGSIDSKCGIGQRAMGPFYCPNDQRVYIDLNSYSDLKGRFANSGDLAQAYVIAHEIGHHVQHLLGIDRKLQEGGRSNLQGEEGNSVRLELQADCFAGMWAQSSEKRELLEPGELDNALKAAASIGDDQLQKQATGTVQPEKFTHGSAKERSAWFKRGYELGSIEACDTFAAQHL